MKILLNPETGSPIEDVQINGQKYFVDKKWGLNSLKKFEDAKVAEFLKDNYGFLVEFSIDEAKQYIDDQNKKMFKCTQCDFKSSSEAYLKKHTDKHAEDLRLEKELGLETITASGDSKFEEKIDTQEVIDQQAKAEGLFGSLVDERKPVAARF